MLVTSCRLAFSLLRRLPSLRGVGVYGVGVCNLGTVAGGKYQQAHVSVTASADPSTTHPGQDEVKKSAALQLNFGNHKTAFKHKTTRELLRGLVVLHSCAVDTLVNHSHKLLSLGERLLGERLLGYMVAPFYNQFVAGDSGQELGVVSQRLASVGVRLMVAPMLETDVGEGHDARVSTAYQSLSMAERVEAVRVVAALLVEVGSDGHTTTSSHLLHPLQLKESDALELIDSLPRLYKLGAQCVLQDVVLAVDAEYTYTNPAINLLSLAMMKVFNNPTPIIWNTYQGYLKAGRENLEHDLGVVRALGGNVGFGAKLVRGAYLERERSLAQEKGYPDPVNNTYEDTAAVYTSMVEVMLQEVAAEAESRAVVVATHNEASVKHAAGRLEQLRLDPQAGNVVFGQVYGMAENISVPLAASGFLVFKSVPSGSMSEVMPYLSRRANENRAVLRGARRERQLLTRELLSRLPFSR
ncbi:Hydroxyproline dehydrogenase-like [Homarus americanus]|uniref:Proline dehydrogenase n=1 Tax=Homarus americanus TaxID=6706 RepID=A0A8J5JY11_HOMAM|nr:Hydroxyproline dehydrogenase-like [Homarus americanus]